MLVLGFNRKTEQVGQRAVLCESSQARGVVYQAQRASRAPSCSRTYWVLGYLEMTRQAKTRLFELF